MQSCSPRLPRHVERRAPAAVQTCRRSPLVCATLRRWAGTRACSLEGRSLYTVSLGNLRQARLLAGGQVHGQHGLVIEKHLLVRAEAVEVAPRDTTVGAELANFDEVSFAHILRQMEGTWHIIDAIAGRSPEDERRSPPAGVEATASDQPHRIGQAAVDLGAFKEATV